MENGMSKSFPQEEIQQYYEGKFTSMVVYKGMTFSRKRWCCATGVKLGTCFAKIVLRLHPSLKILLCLSLSSGKPSPYQNPVQPDPSAENHPCGEFS